MGTLKLASLLCHVQPDRPPVDSSRKDRWPTLGATWRPRKRPSPLQVDRGHPIQAVAQGASRYRALLLHPPERY